MSSKSIMRYYLLSPIPPQPTGTAVYLSFLLRDLQIKVDKSAFAIVIDDRVYEGTIPSSFMGFDVIKYSNFSPNPGDAIIAFIANNIYHRHAHEEMLAKRSRYIVAIIHDVQIAMIMMELCNRQLRNFDGKVLREAMGGQLGRADGVFCDWFEQHSVPTIAKYTAGCQGIALTNANLVVTHSYHAAVKLQIEYALPADKAPHIIVMQHPKADCNKDATGTTNIRSSENQFVIGAFGWFGRAKRLDLVCKVFGLFLDQLPVHERSRVKLQLVGTIIQSEFDIITEANNHRYKDNIQHFGYVPKKMFEELMLKCSLIVNLRFPSCGETSGTLVHAETYNIPTVTSAYQSFYEEFSNFKISINPDTESDELLRVFRSAYSRNFVQTPIDINKPSFEQKLTVMQAFEVISHKLEGTADV